MAILDNDKVQFVTLYTGTKGYHNCYCKCPCCTQKNVNDTYQGKIEQIHELLDKFKNIKQMYFLGNPDALVDATFCNEASKVSIEKGTNVCYSTSGVGGLGKVEELLRDIPSQNVDYVSFSIDSLDPKKMSMLKGINYPWNSVIEAIKWLIKNNYPVKIQPTLWSSNFKDTYDIIKYFSNLGVNSFSFHIGSNETDYFKTHRHLTEDEVKCVHDLITEAVLKYQVKASCPVIYPSVYPNDPNKWYCMHPDKCKELQVVLRESGIYVTNVPIISELDEKYFYNINNPIDLKQINQADVCPIHEQTAKTKTLCRYVKRNWS